MPSPYQKILHPLNNRGIGVFDEDDFEEKEILIPKYNRKKVEISHPNPFLWFMMGKWFLFVRGLDVFKSVWLE